MILCIRLSHQGYDIKGMIGGYDMTNKYNRLLRSKKERVVAGVCGGLAEYFKIDPALVRIIWVIMTILSFGFGIIAYVVFWMVLPEEK